MTHEPPTKQQRIEGLLADETVAVLLAIPYGNDYAKKYTLLDQFVRADPMTHYVKSLETFSERMQRRSKNYGVSR